MVTVILVNLDFEKLIILKMEYEGDKMSDQEEYSSKEYLGTFRWKKSLKFRQLSEKLFPYPISKWSDYIDQRLDFEFEPFIVDALSYPLTIISALDNIKDKLKVYDNTINIILLGTAAKAEGRIAYESNYFDEIYNYLTLILKKTFKLKIFLSGPEMQGNMEIQRENIKYIFYKGKTGDFLKEYMMEFNKVNTFVIGLNCGFGAGYMHLTLSWVNDLTKLLKLGYHLIFTYTNDYEDMIGEIGIFEKLLKSNVFNRVEDNAFKSMTTYKNDDEQWACGNYGYYMINGYDKDNLSNILKYNPEKLKDEVINVFQCVGVNIKN
jgi:hypothetical protein